MAALALAKSYADQHSGGGGQVQPDWNQNDETAPDYVKNRPFYTGDPVGTVMVEESTVSFATAGGYYMAQFQSTFSATVGEPYNVSWQYQQLLNSQPERHTKYLGTVRHMNVFVNLLGGTP